MSSPEIDIKLLPKRALFDTGVVMRALGERPDDEESPSCVALWNAMLENDRQIVIAAPSIYELIRNGSSTRVPRRRGVEVGAFDQLAAEKCAAVLPETELKQQQKGNLKRDYVRYDALIVGIGVRYEVSCIVSIDGRFTKPPEGISSMRPPDFYAKQLPLALPAAR
jgi:predicted nucleic acid-binding protein